MPWLKHEDAAPRPTGGRPVRGRDRAGLAVAGALVARVAQTQRCREIRMAWAAKCPRGAAAPGCCQGRGVALGLKPVYTPNIWQVVGDRIGFDRFFSIAGCNGISALTGAG